MQRLDGPALARWITVLAAGVGVLGLVLLVAGDTGSLFSDLTP